MKKLQEIINNYKQNREKEQKKKKFREIRRKIKDFIKRGKKSGLFYKIVIIISTLALIGTGVLPYILR